MGKRIISQRRGKGSTTYRAPSHRYRGKIKYSDISKDVVHGTIIDIFNDAGRDAPLGLVKFGDGTERMMLIPEGIGTGSTIEVGFSTAVREGNVMSIGDIPEGTPIFNVETSPGDGGKLVRSSGSFAVIVSHDVNKTVIRLPSKSLKSLNPKCKATIGVVAGGERTRKMFAKAGIRWYAARARNKLYPRTSAKSMNAVDHKFGKSAKQKTTKRTAPPGAKVGSFGARRTGRGRSKMQR